MKITVYGDEKELNKIKAMANKSGLSASAYLKECGLQKSRPVLNQAEIGPALYNLTCIAKGCTHLANESMALDDSCPVLSKTMDLVKSKLYGKEEHEEDGYM